MSFHWITAALVAAQWLGAQVIDWFPSGAPRVDARSVHIIGGVLLLALLILRLAWRATGGRRLSPADGGWAGVVARMTHWGLYALLGAMVLVGLVLTWARGDSIFNLFHVPALAPSSQVLAHQLRHQLQEVHALLGYLILGLAGLHAAAALAHRFVWQDGVLARMLPGG
jgi:cytochrome b561